MIEQPKNLGSGSPTTQALIELADRLRASRYQTHGDCCDDADDAVPCGSAICAIEYEAETMLRAAADALRSIRSEDELTFARFSAVNRQRCESPDGFRHPLNGWTTSDWFLAVFGEFGEAANVAKKLNRARDGIPGNKESEATLRDKLRNELGDAYVYLDLLAQSLGVQIGAAAVEVFNAKSEEIGCPIRCDAPADVLRSLPPPPVTDALPPLPTCEEDMDAYAQWLTTFPENYATICDHYREISRRFAESRDALKHEGRALKNRVAELEAEVARLTTALHDESRSPDGDGPHSESATAAAVPFQRDSLTSVNAGKDLWPLISGDGAGSEPADSLSPLRAEVAPVADIDYATLDPGIRDMVRLLREAGFQTTDSGDGVSKPRDARTVEGPHVAAVVDGQHLVAEAERLQAMLGVWWHVEASYSTADGIALVMAVHGRAGAEAGPLPAQPVYCDGEPITQPTRSHLAAVYATAFSPQWQPMETLPDSGQVIVCWADDSYDIVGRAEYLEIMGYGEAPARGWMPLPAGPLPPAKED